MEKPKLLIIAYRALGDWLFTVPVLPFLFEKYDVYLECSYKVYQLVHDDPRFKKIAVFAIENCSDDMHKRYEEYTARWDKLREQIKPDVEINFNGSLEVACIAQNFQPEFNLPVGDRRVAFGSNGFYDAVFARAGIPLPNPLKTDCMYFSEKEEEWAMAWNEKTKKNFRVIIPLSGSTDQKRFWDAPKLAQMVVDKYPDAVVYLAGDDRYVSEIPVHPRIRNMCGNKVSIKQAVLLCKYVDMVVGPETFLLVAAGMWGTPKVILSTASSVYQMAQYQRNDYSIQASIPCSPCHKAIYAKTDCESMASFGPTCARRFSLDTLLEKISYIYELRREDLQRGVCEAVCQERTDGAGQEDIRLTLEAD